MEDGGRGLFQATCITATVYAVLFLAHIVAAAKDMDLAFRTVAALITVLTFSVGICIRFVGRIKGTEAQLRANTIGLCFAPPLAIGLAWAYAEQSFDIIRTVLFLATAIVVHFIDRKVIGRDKASKMG